MLLRNSIWHEPAFVALAAALWAGQAYLGACLRGQQTAFVPPPAEALVRWDPRLFTALSFGHAPAAIDWVWINAMVDPARDHVQRGTHPRFYYNLELVTDVDPAFLEAYTAGGAILAVVRNDVEGARTLLQKGEHFLDHDLSTRPEPLRSQYEGRAWNLHMLLAYVWLFEFDNLVEAAEEFQQAADLPGSPSYLKHLKARLLAPAGKYEVGERLLGFMIQQQTDERVKQEMVTKLEYLRFGRFLFQQTERFAEYLKKHRACGQYPAGCWHDYAASTGIPVTDPWGGRIGVDANGKVISSTPRPKVLGLD